jgi:hypothetical protein
MLLSQLSSTKRSAKEALERRFGHTLQVSFGTQWYRGVICGNFRSTAAGAVRSQPFIYISRYSADSPREDQLFAGEQEVAPRRSEHDPCSEPHWVPSR